MKKFLSIIGVVLLSLLLLVGCSSSNETSSNASNNTSNNTQNNTSTENKGEVNSEDKANVQSTEKNEEDTNIEENKKVLTKEQIETIASDLLSCFNGDETISIDQDNAEYFAFFLVFKRGQQHIEDNYISVIDNLVSKDLTEIKDEDGDGYGTVHGKFVEALGEAIFGVDISAEEKYTLSPFDPPYVGSKLKELKKENEKNIATLDILDDVGQPFITMEIHLSVTKEGYTRIEYVSTEEIQYNNLSEFTNKINYPTSEKVNGEDINYGDYYTVIIPMYHGIYSEAEETQFPFEFKEYTLKEGKTMLHFAVFGEFYLEGFNVVENMGDEGTFYGIGETIKDSIVTVYCDLPTDFSGLGVIGSVIINGENQSVEFGIDDMRDSSDYEILKFR